MYKLKNGILHKDGKPIFGVGVSYYPSFFPGKAPVTEEAEKIPQMKIDLKRMCDFGINIIRTAAIGKIYKKNGRVEIVTPLIDAMMKEAEKDDLAMMVRLQGYHMDISGHDDFRMRDRNGNEVSQNRWNAFIQSCLFHEGVLEDNKLATEELTKHYSAFKSFVSFCVYNEPHYPGGEFYDYHPDTIKAYKKWLAEKNIIIAEEAEDYEVPTKRPGHSCDVAEWVNWRLFSMEALSGFLSNTHNYSKAVNPELEGITSAVTTQFAQGNDLRGVDNFAYARDMDICGFTNYSRVCGNSFYGLSFIHDFMESCAAVYGKHTWIVEYDARTKIPLRNLKQETYLSVGSGIKGIMYYQWRGDAPNGATEEDNLFGFINYDGSETENFNEKKAVIGLLNKYSDYIVNAEKKRSGVAVLHSDYINLFQCAFQKEGCYVANPYEESMKYIYRDFINMGFAVDFVKAEHLEENRLNIKCLIVPEYDYMLSEDEKSKIEAFKNSGGYVFTYSTGAYNELGRGDEHSFLNFDNPGGRTAFEAAAMAEVKPLFDINCDIIKCKVIEGDNYYVISVNNISTTEKIAFEAEIKCYFDISKAVFADEKQEIELSVNNNVIKLPRIKVGGLIIAHKR